MVLSPALMHLDKDESINVDFYYVSFKELSTEFLMYNFLKNIMIFRS